MIADAYRPEIQQARLDIFCPNCNKVHGYNTDYSAISGLSRTMPRLPGGLGWHPTVGIVIITCSECSTEFWSYVITEEDFEKMKCFLNSKSGSSNTA